MQKTQEEISTFLGTARNYIGENCDNDGKPKREDQKDLFYALRRVLVRLQKPQRKYNDKIQDLQEKYAAVDEKEMLVKDEKGEYRFKRADKLKLNEEIRNLYEKGKVEFEPYYATTLPDDLDDEVKEVFSDFVIRVEHNEPS